MGDLAAILQLFGQVQSNPELFQKAIFGWLTNEVIKTARLMPLPDSVYERWAEQGYDRLTVDAIFAQVVVDLVSGE